MIANFHCKYIDANRRAEEAYGSPGCAAAYEAYHAAVRGHVDALRAKFPHAMLFDIHGQSAFPGAILRGTRHGGTVQALLARAGVRLEQTAKDTAQAIAAFYERFLRQDRAAPQ